MRLIDADALYERTTEWEAAAIKQVKKVMRDGDKMEWTRWSAILGERTAFSQDVYNAPTIDVAPIRCKECKWYGEPGCAIRIVDDTDKPSDMDFCSFAERKEGD